MRGNEIMVSSQPRGHKFEGFILAATYPGTIMQIDPGVAPQGGWGSAGSASGGEQIGNFTWRVATPGANGGLVLPLAVLDLDYLQGGTETQQCVAGQLGNLWIPLAGDEMNILCATGGSGGGGSTTIGGAMIVQNATGLLINTTGSPSQTPFVSLEAISLASANTLVWCQRA